MSYLPCLYSDVEARFYVLVELPSGFIVCFSGGGGTSTLAKCSSIVTTAYTVVVRMLDVYCISYYIVWASLHGNYSAIEQEPV